MAKLFNSVYEMKLRTLFVLAAKPDEVFSVERINAIDFISLYGKLFDVADVNIHGDSPYKYAELASRRELIKEATRTLVLEGLVFPDLRDGFSYGILDAGKTLVGKFESEYAVEYRSNVERTMQQYGDYSEQDLMKLIERNSVVINAGGK